MLHPTMIYGAEGEDNVRRLEALMRRLPNVPLPAGGRSLVQPIHQSDVTRAILAALGSSLDRAVHDGDRRTATSILSGLHAGRGGRVRHRAASDADAPRRPIDRFGAPYAVYPRCSGDRCRGGDRLPARRTAFDITQMRDTLGVTPTSLAEGLAHDFFRLSMVHRSTGSLEAGPSL